MSEYNTNPSGLYPKDNLKDCIDRSDEISRPDGSCHSGMMCDRKDLRRIVLMAREIRDLQGKLRALAKPETSKEALNLASIIKCPLCGAETLYTDPERCTTPDCPNCIF